MLTGTSETGRGLADRAWGRIRRGATRAGQRIRGIPVRLAERAAGFPVPPARLLHAVGGSDDPSWFLTAGTWAAEDLRNAMARHGEAIEEVGALLDFGCGVGRVVRHWGGLAASGVEVVGTDYNPAMIAWCRRNLPFARFARNAIDGRIDADDGTFGLAYALSVFTHLDEPLQRHWLAELRRVLRPGGFLLITLHGLPYRDGLPPEDREAFDRGELVVVGHDRQGSNHCAAFHPPGYLASGPAEDWEILEWIPEGARGNPRQDAYLLRKPAVARARAA
ncbi:class I SAM-dependent methyltransferase [Tautonia sociabilis]|uniref:Class I SAM-dependent methyltransferase n=1 Tax=Tautonia sociabilis TaxID=2080755 RepID=A0A432MFD0_9BACT|nr:class I SAM-dependent methyltransferase [Tautonia sociabilis]RUL84630.1 class I SAM-dependent methyltransferase [Tautonia sociabilis]